MEEFRREVSKALQCAEHLKFDKSHPWHRHLMALYGALVEYSDSLIHLAMAKKSVAIPVVFRSFLEAYVDFKNLAEDRRYGNHMEASYSKELLRVLEETEDRKNPYLAGNDVEITTKIQHHRDRLVQLKASGYPPLSNYAKFDKAGMVDEYRSIYNFLCSDSHNNIRSLIDRFVIINKDQNDFELVFFKDSPSSEFDHYLSTALHFLRNSSHNIHAVLETGYEHAFPV